MRRLGIAGRLLLFTQPEVRRALRRVEERARRIPNPELRAQALASLQKKQFHCEGGAVYATVAREPGLLELIVALQTISDYLDNLCDRSVSMDGADFRQLHQAYLEAVQPGASLSDYYLLHPNKDDGGYLAGLVRTCQEQLARLPGYQAVQPQVLRLAALYCDLQVYKHVAVDQRVPLLASWHAVEGEAWPSLRWYEFAAATGSTLGLFSLFGLAVDPKVTSSEVEGLLAAYVPWVCGLHILLDYYIDQAEDRVGGDLNFCFYYDSREDLVERLSWFVRQASSAVAPLPAVHRLVVPGLVGFYLADPKASTPELAATSAQLVAAGGGWSRLVRWLWRRFG